MNYQLLNYLIFYLYLFKFFSFFFVFFDARGNFSKNVTLYYMYYNYNVLIF